MPKKLIEIASEIVQTQVSRTAMTAADIASSLRQVFRTLHELQRAESGEIQLPKGEAPAPAKKLKPEDTIQNDKVICLECGAEMRQLSKFHLVTHGMTAKEYKKKYGFTMRTPLSAKSLTKARRKAAKKNGVPENLKKYVEARRQAKAEMAKPALTPENSIQEDKIICLGCGAEFKQLTGKHLASHGLTPTEYKKKYGFSTGTPLLAKSVYKAMKEAAQKRGLPENLKKAVEAKKQPKKESANPVLPSDGPGAQRAKRVKRLFSPKRI
jgi:predicted transcriptional regulator